MKNQIAPDLLENLVYIRYLDHILFNYSNPLQYSPIKRETIGWLVKEDDKAVWIVADRSVESFIHQVKDSGRIILKTDILEMKRLAKLDVKYCSDEYISCRVCASGKRSEKLDPPIIGGGKNRENVKP